MIYERGGDYFSGRSSPSLPSYGECGGGESLDGSLRRSFSGKLTINIFFSTLS